MDIIYDHKAEHYISDVPKHSSNGGFNPRNFSLPPCKIIPSEFWKFNNLPGYPWISDVSRRGNWRSDNWCEHSRLRQWGGEKRHRGSSDRGLGAQPPEIFWSLSAQTTRRSNLALADRRFNHIFTDSYNKLSRLTVYEHIT